MHLVKHLPSNQGKKRSPVILFLDGHASRWDVPSMLYLMEHNVFPFYIASHTSIQGQPNNNGPNFRWHKCVENAIARMGLRTSVAKTKHSYFNLIIRYAWEEFMNQERLDLLTTASNNTTRAYARCGIYPFNPYCSGWEDILSTLGKLNKELKKKELDNDEYEIVLREDEVKLTDEEKKIDIRFQNWHSLCSGSLLYLPLYAWKTK